MLSYLISGTGGSAGAHHGFRSGSEIGGETLLSEAPCQAQRRRRTGRAVGGGRLVSPPAQQSLAVSAGQRSGSACPWPPPTAARRPRRTLLRSTRRRTLLLPAHLPASEPLPPSLFWRRRRRRCLLLRLRRRCPRPCAAAGGRLVLQVDLLRTRWGGGAVSRGESRGENTRSESHRLLEPRAPRPSANKRRRNRKHSLGPLFSSVLPPARLCVVLPLPLLPVLPLILPWNVQLAIVQQRREQGDRLRRGVRWADAWCRGVEVLSV